MSDRLVDIGIRRILWLYDTEYLTRTAITADFSDEEMADYQRVNDAWRMWQDRLRDTYDKG